MTSRLRRLSLKVYHGGAHQRGGRVRALEGEMLRQRADPVKAVDGDVRGRATFGKWQSRQ